MVERTAYGVRLSAVCVLVAIMSHAAARAQEAGAENFLNTCRIMAEAGEGMSVNGRDGWLFLRNELRHLGKGEFWGEAAQRVNPAGRESSRDPLAAITAYHDALTGAGIHLLFVPIPPKAIVYPDKIDPQIQDPLPRLDVFHQTFYALLREKGVDVLDVTLPLIEGRQQAPTYCRTDTHYSPRGLKIVARAIAERIKAQPWYAQVPKSDYITRRYEAVIAGDLLREYEGAAPPKEEMVFEAVSPAEGARPIDEKESPVLLLADSHGLIFHGGGDMLAVNAGLADHLALELGFPVDLYGTRGSGATPTRVNLYRAARRDPGYIGKKKLLIWLLSAREFTESAWSAAVPVLPD